MQLNTFTSSDELNQTFAKRLTDILSDAIAKRGRAYLVVSGGRTPQALFQKLSQADIDWSKVTITLADDRFLPDSEADSNERLVKASLLQHKAAQAAFISLYAPFDKAELAVPELLKRVADLPTFDAVILGMGEDGHTASLFPCSQEVQAGIRVARLGTSSVRYEVGLFASGEALCAAAGHFVHVYVDRETRRPVPLPAPLKQFLETLT